jgi:hypothetical protein
MLGTFHEQFSQLYLLCLCFVVIYMAYKPIPVVDRQAYMYSSDLACARLHAFSQLTSPTK